MAKLWQARSSSTLNPVVSHATTLVDMFWEQAQQREQRIIMRQKAFGIWQQWTWSEVAGIVDEIAAGLMEMGLQAGECVSILSNTSAQWLWCDFAVLSAGGISNGIYPTDSAGQVHYLCEDSSTVILVVEDEEQLDKALAVRARLPSLRQIIVLDVKGVHDWSDPMLVSLDQVRDRGQTYLQQHRDAVLQRRQARKATDVAILIYTSGTTGRPKGAMHCHGGLLATIRIQETLHPQSEDDERMCFLPLCHVAERVVGAYASLYTGTKMNFVENPDTVPENVREIAPTVFGGVPRMWEKFYSSVTLSIRESGRVQRWGYTWAIAVGYEIADRYLAGQPISTWMKLKYHLAGVAALNHVRRFIGVHRCRYMVTGAAPISAELIRWYLALGIPMLEAWGQTESCGISTSMRPSNIRLGTIGQASPVNEVRIDPDTGELLVRGPNVFMGYLNQEEKTREALDESGWLHTGDVGQELDGGFFRITDRMKDIIITAGGKNVTPSEWENELKFSPYVTDAVVIGDRRPYLVAIVMIELDNVEKFAQEKDIPFSNYTSLARRPEVRELIAGEIDRINRKFARVEQIKKFYLLDNQLSAEDEELTPTMKLKRKLVEQKYAEHIEAMYRDERVR